MDKLFLFLMGVGFAEVSANSSFAKPPRNLVGDHEGFMSQWNKIEYKGIDNFNGVYYLHANNIDKTIRREFRITTDRSVPVIHDNLAKTEYVVAFNKAKNRTDVMRAYLDSSKSRLVVENPDSKTKYSVATGDGKGNISFKDYDPKQGLDQNLRSVRQTVTTDSYGNRFILTDDGTAKGSTFYPVFRKSSSNIPVVFNEVTGDILLVYQKSRGSPLQLENLEADMHDSWRTVDLTTGKVLHYVRDINGILEFSDRKLEVDFSGNSYYPINLVPGTSKTAVKREFKIYFQYQERPQEHVYITSVDMKLFTFHRLPVESVDNLLVVYDFFTSYAYFVIDDGLYKLYTGVNNTHVIHKNSTGYFTVTVDDDKNLDFKRYVGDAKKLKHLTRKFEYSITVDENLNQILTASFNGTIEHKFPVLKDTVHNIPVVYNQLSGQAMLIAAHGPKLYYALEKSAPGKLVAVDTSTNEKHKFIVKADGCVVIQKLNM